MTELTSDVIFGGAGGAAIGFGIGYAVKKMIKPLLKFFMVIAILYVGSLLYLKSIGVISINQKAADNLIQNTQNSVNNVITNTQICDTPLLTSNNQVINNECVNNIVAGIPIQNMLATLGIPMTFGLGFGILLGWSRG